jgi:hypothetical protein
MAPKKYTTKTNINKYSYLFLNRISGVMVSMFASSVVDRRFEPESGQTKDYKNLTVGSDEKDTYNVFNCWFR